MQVGHGYHVIGTHCSIGVRGRTAAEVAVSIETNNRCRYSNFAEHSLHNWVGHDRTKRREVRQDFAVLVFAQRAALRGQRLHVAQWRRDIELHDRQHAAKLGLYNRVGIG